MIQDTPLRRPFRTRDPTALSEETACRGVGYLCAELGVAGRIRIHQTRDIGTAQGAMTGTWLVGLAAAMGLLLFALQSAVESAVTWAWSGAGQRMVYALAGDLFARLQRLALTYHARGSVGDSLSRLTEDTYSVYTLTSSLGGSGTEKGVVFLANGSCNCSSSGGVGAGMGAFLVSDQNGNLFRVTVHGGAGTVEEHMQDPNGPDGWSTRYVNWRY